MTIAQGMNIELEHEAATTRRFLERVPQDKLGWKPHEKSLSAGQLAFHIASAPQYILKLAQQDAVDMPGSPGGSNPQPASKQEILDTFDQTWADAQRALAAFTDEQMLATWSFSVAGKPVFAFPRVAMLRSFLISHLIHHRGQLGVYLRLLGAKVPSAYGPSGDEIPEALAKALNA